MCETMGQLSLYGSCMGGFNAYYWCTCGVTDRLLMDDDVWYWEPIEEMKYVQNRQIWWMEMHVRFRVARSVLLWAHSR